jgi:hypothetical protein
MENKDTEIWIDIKGHEGCYQISNHGKVKSLDRIVIKSNGVKMFRKGQIMTSVNYDGYMRVRVEKKVLSVHRLVAKHFIPNPENFSQVDHIDGNTLNAHVDNLRWCNGGSNMKNAWNNRSRTMSKHKAPNLLNGEIWKTINNIGKDFYQISNFGRVRALKHTTISIDNKTYYIPEKLITQHKGRADYFRVTLNEKAHRVHILVAKEFIKNPNNLPDVDHINGDKNNNSVENLRWSSKSDNMLNAVKNGLRKIGSNHSQARSINQFTMEKDFVQMWGSIADAGKHFFSENIGKSITANVSNIRSVLIGRSNYALGHYWEYTENLNEKSTTGVDDLLSQIDEFNVSDDSLFVDSIVDEVINLDFDDPELFN